MKTQTNAPNDHVLTAAAPQASDEQAQAVALEQFGLHCQAQLLAGERDLNFHLRCQDGRQFLLKVSNSAEDVNVTDFQNKALLHVQRTDPTLPVSRVYPNQSGTYQIPVELGGQQVLVRLLSFVEGVQLNKIEAPSQVLRKNLGVHLARLGIALRGFFHPAAGHELLWDIKHCSRMGSLLDLIPDLEDRSLVARFLENFETYALPRLQGLRAQVIHNDLNFHNVIVERDRPENIRTILDFGDMVHAPLINDLAVGASYQLGAGEHVLSQALPFIGAYNSVCPLEEVEQEILFDLIAARMVMTVAITNWRATMYPENRAYILRNAPSAWVGLRGFSNIPRGLAQEQIARICSMEAMA